MTSTTEQVRDELIERLTRHGDLLESLVEDQLQLLVRGTDHLLALGALLAGDRFRLVTVVGNDERELESGRFKIYYLFAHPTVDLFVMLEFLLDPPGSATYPSLVEHFPAVDCFERELLDLLGLRPDGARAGQVAPGAWLHESYPPDLYPLRRTQTIDQLNHRVAAHRPASEPPPHHAAPASGALTLPIGPIHAAVIEPGEFRFTIAGEAIEDLEIRLGYTHRGLERLFQSQVSLPEGWWLAEQVSGDSSFAHSLAYCHAAEKLMDAVVPRAARLVRTVFLELERIHNHVADVAGLAEDVALDRLGSEIAVVREWLLRLNQRISNSRYLRGVNRPGGVVLPGPLDAADIAATLATQVPEFGRAAKTLRGEAGFRTRTIGVGVLPTEPALRLGVTGLTARASGVRRDSRWDHPIEMYGDAVVRTGDGRYSDDPEARAGDVYARFLTRVHEVEVAHAIITALLDRWAGLTGSQQTRLWEEPRVRPENNYISAVGYAEGFRGDVVYWLMQDKLGGIYRCKIRDSSMLNWPALRHAVVPQPVARGGKVTVRETVLADFPLVNKSFNLSYAGNDL